VVVVKLSYGCGLRLFEGLRLRVQRFNFDARLLTVHDGKGKRTAWRHFLKGFSRNFEKTGGAAAGGAPDSIGGLYMREILIN
jgi:hypothetical protein